MNRRGVLAFGLASAAAAPASFAATGGEAGVFAQRFADALSAHDIDAFAALFADDYVNHQRSAAAPPPPPGTKPKDSTVAFFRSRLIGMPDLRVSVEQSLAVGDRFAASFVYEGTHQGPYLGVPPTGKTLRFSSCDIFRVAENKIAEHWGMGDIAGIMAQLKG